MRGKKRQVIKNDVRGHVILVSTEMQLTDEDEDETSFDRFRSRSSFTDFTTTFSAFLRVIY